MSKIHHVSSEIDLAAVMSNPGRGEKVVSPIMRDPDSLGMATLSVVLISRSSERRTAIAEALAGPQASIARELTEYPNIDDLTHLADSDYDVVIVDLDGDPERALDLVEGICSANSAKTVMMFSNQADPDLLVRCMRAGAREFLTEPIRPNKIAEALVRASARRQEARRQKKTAGKVLLFVGAKGGSGTTTVAANFAVALAKESQSKVALVDLNLPLGDAALTLGLSAQFSMADALENMPRLDSDFLATLLAKHSSGVLVLAAPDGFNSLHPSTTAVEKLMRLFRDDFQYVVVDAGTHYREMGGLLFEMADVVYLVSQVSMPELRNSNRLITHHFSDGQGSKLEIVLNRFTPRNLEIDENGINKALTTPAKWKLPNEYAVARRAQNAGAPIVLEDTALARALSDMARAVSGQTAQPGKKKKFGLFG